MWVEKKVCDHLCREPEYKDKESGNDSVDTGVGNLMMFKQGSKLPKSLP